jgi:hypothetical protein
MQISLIPQTQISTIFDKKNPLFDLATKFPKNMCWLTTMFYACQYMGFENNKKLHKKLSRLLYISVDLMAINEENGAMLFPAKYQLGDKFIRQELNKIFDEIGLKIKVERILSDITYEEIHVISKYAREGKQLLTIIKNIDFKNPDAEVTNEVPNHVVLLKELEDNGDGRVKITLLDPADGQFYTGYIGVHVFILWIQYVWVLERKRNIVHRIIKRLRK